MRIRATYSITSVSPAVLTAEAKSRNGERLVRHD